jgi:hypothetical protein
MVENKGEDEAMVGGRERDCARGFKAQTPVPLREPLPISPSSLISAFLDCDFPFYLQAGFSIPPFRQRQSVGTPSAPRCSAEARRATATLLEPTCMLRKPRAKRRPALTTCMSIPYLTYFVSLRSRAATSTNARVDISVLVQIA